MTRLGMKFLSGESRLTLRACFADGRYHFPTTCCCSCALIQFSVGSANVLLVFSTSCPDSSSWRVLWQKFQQRSEGGPMKTPSPLRHPSIGARWKQPHLPKIRDTECETMHVYMSNAQKLRMPLGMHVQSSSFRSTFTDIHSRSGS